MLLTTHAAALLLAASVSSATTEKLLLVPRLQNVPTIDGIVTPEEWRSAATFSDLHQVEPAEFAEPTEKTTFYVAYDDDYFYVAVHAFDSDPSGITARQLIQGENIFSDDRIEIILDPFASRRDGYRFAVNPNGVRVDALFETANDSNFDWDAVWDARSSIDERGWHSEIAIPFRSLNFDKENATWGFSVVRDIARKRERLAWTSFDRDTDPSSAGRIGGIRGARQGRGLDLVPSLVLNQRWAFPGDNSGTTEPALDIFYKVTPSLNAIATFNTDFSAVDVDDRQVNLTRFSLFFPEKRDFFLQDSDVFRFANIEENGVPFFSRRIGLSNDARPIDINVGLKLAGRVGDWSIGLLAVDQDAPNSSDSEQLFVGRASLNILEESSAGVIVTAGNPGGDIDNTLVGFDFNYVNSGSFLDRSINASAWVQQTATDGLDGDNRAYGVSVGLPNSDGFSVFASHSVLEQNFEPALGFANRSGARVFDGELTHRRWVNGQRLRWMESGVFFNEYSSDITGELQSRELFLSPLRLEFDSGDQIQVGISRTEELLDETFEVLPGVEVLPGRYRYDRVNLNLEGGYERSFSPELRISHGDFFSGQRSEVNARINWLPNRNLRMDLGYELNRLQFNDTNYYTRVITGRVNVAFNSRWAWTNSLQYDNFSEEMSINSRLRWIPQAGRELTFVANRSFVRELSGRFRSLTQELVLKAVYLIRF